ncbi:hypothetical protein EDD11_004212 [Mortierella claussenii]|nr:hypothetical protein EDD11_004212 [Mortierella claussenii]
MVEKKAYTATATATAAATMDVPLTGPSSFGPTFAADPSNDRYPYISSSCTPGAFPSSPACPPHTSSTPLSPSSSFCCTRSDYKVLKRSLKAEVKCAKRDARFVFKELKHETKHQVKEIQHEAKHRAKELKKEARHQTKEALKTVKDGLKEIKEGHHQECGREQRHGCRTGQQQHQCENSRNRGRSRRERHHCGHGHQHHDEQNDHCCKCSAQPKVRVLGIAAGMVIKAIERSLKMLRDKDSRPHQRTIDSPPVVMVVPEPLAAYPSTVPVQPYGQQQDQDLSEKKQIGPQEPLLIYNMVHMSLNTPTAPPASSSSFSSRMQTGIHVTPVPARTSVLVEENIVPPPSYEAAVGRRA